MKETTRVSFERAILSDVTSERERETFYLLALLRKLTRKFWLVITFPIEPRSSNGMDTARNEIIKAACLSICFSNDEEKKIMYVCT